jgi:RNA polymerase sigma-70 factor, ECF subfamily
MQPATKQSCSELASPAFISDPDLVLVQASRAGDVAAFEHLVKRYDRRLLRIAMSITHNLDDAREVVQDAFFKAYRNLNKFREDARFSTWLTRIALNESLMKLRKQRGYQELTISDNLQDENEGNNPAFDPVEWSADPEELYGAAEFREILIKSLEKLTPALKVVFVLRDMEEHSILQTAEILNLTTHAVKARLSRARQQLRAELSMYFNTHLFADRREPLLAGNL